MRHYGLVGILIASISTLHGMDALKTWLSRRIHKKDTKYPVIPGAVSFIIHESTACYLNDCKKGRRMSRHEHCPGHSDGLEIKKLLEDQNVRVVAFYSKENLVIELNTELISKVPRYESTQTAYKKLDPKAQARLQLS